ncbi:MAG: 2-methylcitrate dehydratase, partial [Legionellaceae bacterium]|nr:2-methylcitrate dehydratase [Legionellaceae bacterium]
ADFSKDYLDPDKRAIANSLRLHFTDGTSSDWVTVAYPIGHERRRAEGIPILMEKCHKNIRTRYPEGQSQKIMTAFWSLDHFMDMNFLDFMQLWECEA